MQLLLSCVFVLLFFFSSEMVVGFERTEYSAEEDSPGSVTLTVRRFADSDTSLILVYSTTDRTATSGE